MGKDHKYIQLFNSNIPEQFRDLAIKKFNLPNYSIAFNNYNMIYKILQKNQPTTQKISLKIYDSTIGLNQPGKIFRVNDHINRIGDNPFIGRQQLFNIDFINVEKLYIQKPNGIITNSCGERPQDDFVYPSTHLANIAMLGFILNYQIEGYLIHV